MSRMHCLTKLLPIGFKHLEELHSLAKSRYDMDFHQFQLHFRQGLIKIFGAWMITSVLNFLSTDSKLEIVIGTFAIFLNRITIGYVYFYIVLMQSLISFYINYIEQKVVTNRPKLLSELNIELIFIKTNHLKLYEISNIVNLAFGWTLVMIFIQEFNEIITQICWFLSIMDSAYIFRTICN